MGQIITQALQLERDVRVDLEKFLVFWCSVMHDDITWPRNGRYRCLCCGRTYPVPWTDQEPSRAQIPALPADATLDHAQMA